MKIDWNMLPKESQWAAMDKDKVWWGYKSEPTASIADGTWSSEDGIAMSDSLNDSVDDCCFNWSEGTPWTETLTKRPEEVKLVQTGEFDPTRKQPTPAQEYEAVCLADEKPTYNTPDGEPPFDPPPASADRAIRTILEVIHDLRALKREELDSPISSLKTAIYRLSDKL